MAWDGKERRRKKRYGVKGSSVRYRFGSLLSLLRPLSPKYLLLNIGDYGCHFITREEMPTGQALRLAIQAPSVKGNVSVSGFVIWCRRSERSNAFHVGVEFETLSGRARGLLKKLLDSAILENVEMSTKVYLKEIERL